MARVFPDHPEALANTVAIAEMCDVRRSRARARCPPSTCRPGFTIESYFEKVARDGFAERRKRARRRWPRPGRLRYPLADYEARLDKEIGVIRRVGFAGYFLIVWDFIRYARETGHPGRARAAARPRGASSPTACASPTSTPSSTT